MSSNSSSASSLSTSSFDATITSTNVTSETASAATSVTITTSFTTTTTFTTTTPISATTTTFTTTTPITDINATTTTFTTTTPITTVDATPSNTSFPLLIVTGASVGGALLLLCLLVCLCTAVAIATRKKYCRKVELKEMPKFRVIDAPNPIYSEIPPELHTRRYAGMSMGWSSSDRESCHPRPASTPEMTQSVSTDHSYALPNEIRVIPSSVPADDEGYSYAVASSVPRKRAATEGARVASPYSCPITTNPNPNATSSSPPFSPLSNIKSATMFVPKSSAGSLTENIYMKPATNTESLYAQIKTLKVPNLQRNTIIEKEPLGSGQFGYVMRGSWVPDEGADVVDVAIKILKGQSSIMEKIKFLQEAAIMAQFHHPNIVQLYGVVTDEKSLMIVLELLPKGDLRKVLTDLRSQLSEVQEKPLASQLLDFCRDIASGMNYLAAMSFVHRDLAARNILVTEDNSCKIGDFGMSRDLEDEDYYISHGGIIPVKWSAPEALSFRKYSTASDIWSFGVLLYEIWSTGQKPFAGKTNGQTLQLVEGGYRLPPPPGCPRTVYELMIQCWHPESKARPLFSDVLLCLSCPDEELLKWTKEDRDIHPLVTTLGVDISIGENLYTDLQMAYV